MRTTVDIPDPIYRALKKKAAHEGQSVKELLVRGAELQLRAQPKKTGRRRPPVIDSDKPGSLELDNAKIYEIIPFP
jgi:hypothetical protein